MAAVAAGGGLAPRGAPRAITDNGHAHAWTECGQRSRHRTLLLRISQGVGRRPVSFGVRHHVAMAAGSGIAAKRQAANSPEHCQQAEHGRRLRERLLGK